MLFAVIYLVFLSIESLQSFNTLISSFSEPGLLAEVEVYMPAINRSQKEFL